MFFLRRIGYLTLFLMFVTQRFRDLLHTKYSSSTKAKARARTQQRIHQYESVARSLQLTGHSSLEYGESASSDDDSVGKGLYPSAPRSMPALIAFSPVAMEPKLREDCLKNGTSASERPTTIPSPDIDPLAIDDDSIGTIDSLVEDDIQRRRSSAFDDDMKVFAELMRIAL